MRSAREIRAALAQVYWIQKQTEGALAAARRLAIEEQLAKRLEQCEAAMAMLREELRLARRRRGEA